MHIYRQEGMKTSIEAFPVIYVLLFQMNSIVITF